ncbi:MAG: 2-nitropropane dioxygenase [Solirubrobacterales bacterium]|nr:2-nitropropane dioxygenase [Solirubrobacterales bacterium]
MVLDELTHPVVLAPLAGGPSTPALAAAVGDAGGLGFLAAGYRSAEDFGAELRELRGLSAAPFGVNLFVPGPDDADAAGLRAYRNELRGESERVGAEPGEPRYDDDGWDAKLALLRAEPVPVVSFTFGCPAPETVASLRATGAEAWVTVTDPAEARIARDAGADVLVLQGVEAGGHRGSFSDADDAEGYGILALLRVVAGEIDLPLVAAGGIADGAGVAAVLAGGAAAAQIGTAFLRAAEAGPNPAHAAALAEETATALTRAFTGRTARGLRNRFLDDHTANAPRGYPHLHYLTAPMRAAARKRGDAGGFNLWAGQAHRLAREAPAGEIVRELGEGARAALARATERVGWGE